MSFKERIRFWLNASEYDWQTARAMFKTGRYLYVLFLCHLTVEKLLKALVVQNTKKDPPYTHNLARLASLAETELTEEELQLCDNLNKFQIEARYDSYKQNLAKLADKNYTEMFFNLTNKLRLCLKKLIKI